MCHLISLCACTNPRINVLFLTLRCFLRRNQKVILRGPSFVPRSKQTRNGESRPPDGHRKLTHTQQADCAFTMFNNLVGHAVTVGIATTPVQRQGQWALGYSSFVIAPRALTSFCLRVCTQTKTDTIQIRCSNQITVFANRDLYPVDIVPGIDYIFSTFPRHDLRGYLTSPVLGFLPCRDQLEILRQGGGGGGGTRLAVDCPCAGFRGFVLAKSGQSRQPSETTTIDYI